MMLAFNGVGIIIAIVVAIVASLLKKKEGAEEFELPPELKPRRQPPKPPATVGNWEEELRRVLAGQTSAPTPPAPPVMPRPVRRAVRPPVPPPLSDDTGTRIAVSLARPEARIEPTFQPLAGLTEAAQHYDQAASLHERVEQHMHDLTTHAVGTTAAQSARRRGVSAEYRDLVEAFRTPGGARSAIVASIVFGPPRGMES